MFCFSVIISANIANIRPFEQSFTFKYCLFLTMIENVNSITPQQINYILELNIERNFQRASEKCFVTQPTLSMQVKKAEELLGFAIFDRSRSPIELTLSGQQLVPILKDIQIEYARMAALTKKVKDKYIEQVKVGVIPTISAFLLLDIFEKVQKELGTVQFKFQELKSEELIGALEEKQIDLAIMAGPFNEPRMRTVPLFQEEIKIFYPISKTEIIHPDDLHDEQPWLLSKGNCLRTQMVHFCSVKESPDTQLKWNYEGGNIDLLMKMVELNGGYTLIPENYKIKSHHLKRLFDPKTNEYPAREIIAILPTKSLKVESCEALIRIIQLQYNSRKKEDLKIIGWK